MGPLDSQPLPVGTVTLLLADVEGSTRLWEARPAEMSEAMARFATVVRDTVSAHGGVMPVEQGEGDSFVAAFARASGAAACAFELQRNWSDGSWPFRVRMAVHTGEVQTRGAGNYEGPTIIRCARLHAIAHGGQVVLSQATRDLVADDLPSGAWLDDMGVHSLKDLDRPEHVSQLRHPDLSLNATPLVSSGAPPPSNLPTQLSSFVGRTREIATLLELMQANRMVTLLGTGGAGKTRLSLRVAEEVADRHPDGVWFVDLTPVEDPSLVSQAVATTLGVREQGGRAVDETIAASLLNRHALVVLDNCEHVVSAAASVASTLLSACPTLSILATSREALGVAGELTFTVPSLDADGEAALLFAERAAKQRPGFAISPENDAAITEICRRLDGMPLAIELAAARVRALSPEQIRDGLADRFGLLTSGARTLQARQQTLRGSVDWSHDLLSDEERVAWRRLSIFVGGFDLEAAAALLGEASALDLVASLVDKSIVVADDRGRAVRYRMLETIRQYGAERLDEAGEREEIARRHREYFQGFLSRASREEEGPDQVEWRARVTRDMDNVRAALQSALAAPDGAALIELTVGAGNTLTLLGASSEHHRWLAEALATAPSDSPFLPSAMYQLGIAKQFSGEIETAAQLLGDSVPLYRAAGDEVGALWAFAEYTWMVAYLEGLDVALPLYEEGMARAEEVGAEGARYSMVYGLAQYLILVGRLDEARERVEPLLRRPAPVEHFGQWATLILAMAMAMLGEVDAASPLAEGVLDYGLQASDFMAVAMASWVLALVRLSQGRVGEARVAVDTISSTAWAMGPVWMAWLLEGAAAVSIAEGDLPGARTTARQLAASLPEVNIAIGRVVEASLVDVLVELGELDEAKARLVEALRSTDREVAPAHRARALIALARVSRRTEHLADAGEHLHEALAISHAMGHKRGVVDVLELLGACAAERGGHAEAVRLLAAADTIRHETGYVYRPPTQQAEYSVTESETRSVLGPEFDDRWSDGAALSWEEACEYAARGRGERKRPATGWDALTPMEAQVASAVAEGLTNSEVGARLFISKHTVDSHLRHIYSKLGVSNRAELATRAARRDGAGA